MPVGVNVYKVSPRITSALRTSGVKGPITIYAYGNVVQLSRSSQEALAASDIRLNHVPRGNELSGRGVRTNISIKQYAVDVIELHGILDEIYKEYEENLSLLHLMEPLLLTGSRFSSTNNIKYFECCYTSFLQHWCRCG